MFEWLSLDNPVALWWYFLTAVSAVNILAWIWTYVFLRTNSAASRSKDSVDIRLVRMLVILSAVYVFGCGFRSLLPRADVQRICLFDTWLSSVLVGRTVATLAELSFVAQWALVLNFLARTAQSTTARRISYAMVPIIFIAECSSWTAVTTTNYVFNACEESLWAATYVLLAIGLRLSLPKFKGPLKYAISAAIAGSLLYVAFMVKVDVPMYLSRWHGDSLSGKATLGLAAGFHDLATHWQVTHDIRDWHDEIPWMSLYFSLAVWTSIALCYVPVVRFKIQKIAT